MVPATTDSNDSFEKQDGLDPSLLCTTPQTNFGLGLKLKIGSQPNLTLTSPEVECDANVGGSAAKPVPLSPSKPPSFLSVGLMKSQFDLPPPPPLPPPLQSSLTSVRMMQSQFDNPPPSSMSVRVM